MENKRTATCPVCGKAFEKPVVAAFDLCAACLKGTAEKYAVEPKSAWPVRRQIRWALWTVLAACAGILLARRTAVQTAWDRMSPVMVAPDPAQECVARLWEASAAVQEGRWPVAGLACPASGLPYASIEKDGDLVVSCPTPAAHGFKSARVSRLSPSPEIILK